MTFSNDTGGFAADRPQAGAWRWRLEDSAGMEVSAPRTAPGDGPRFTAQADAESWLGEWWRDLLDEGVDQVSLLEADRLVYGPMSLHT